MVVNEKSKRNKIVIIAFLITAILATTITSVLAFGETKEGYRTITVIEIQGTVGVVRNNMEYAAYTGMHLEEGYTIVTGGNSYIRLLLDDDKYVKLEAGTKAIFSAVSGGKTAIDIERGALVAEVTKPLQVDEDFVINTPNAVLAVRGTLFRVDLSRNDKGELNTDVMTYGGAVSSKRVQPNGDVDNVEVTVKEGFKATVNMDDKETVYLVDEVKVDLSALVGSPSGDNKPDDTTTLTNANGETVTQPALTLESVLMPIVVEDIPDDDLVDIYFAAENGHSMFIETKEIKTKIEERNIDISEKTPVYEVAKNVIKPVEIIIPDDNKPLLITTEVETEQVVAVQGTPNDGVGDETTTEVTTETITELVTTEPTTVVIITVPTTTVPTTTVPTTTVPTTTVPTTTVPTTTVPTTTVPTTIVPTTESTTVTTTEQTTEPTTEETTVHTHIEMTEEVKATCTQNGLKTVKCSTCGEIISETVLAATGHSEILSGSKDAHTECEKCYEVLSVDHSYQTTTTNASCTLDGGITYICSCGYNYIDTIPATGHTEKTTTVDATCTVDGKITVSCLICTETLSETVLEATGHTEEKGASADIHAKCAVCKGTLKDGTYHNYSDEITTPNSCTTEGVLTHTCSCGWNYTEGIPASHTKADSTLFVTKCSACGGDWVDLISENFPDSMFLSYVSSKFNTDTKVGDVALIGEELTGVTTINVAGDSTTDGGYTYLTGIKHFTNLVNVNCAYNSGITSLDLSGLTSLTELDVRGLTGLKTLNISGCTNLTDEKIIGLDTCIALTELNVSGCTNISELNLNNNNKLETVNLNGCTALTSFMMCDGTKQYFLSDIDLTGCTKLETLKINSTMNLKSIDLSDVSKLKTIDLGGCQAITGTLDVSNKTNLTTVTMGGLDEVTTLNVTGCKNLASINTSACSQLATIEGLDDCSAIKTLVLNGTALTSLDLSGKTTLTSLTVNAISSLETLNLKNTSISTLNLTGTAVESLDISGSKIVNSSNITWIDTITTLDMSNTAIDNVDFSTLTSLTHLIADNADIDDTEIATLFDSNVQELSIAGNKDITAITTADEVSISETLKVLNARETGLETITLYYNLALEELDVSNCEVLDVFFMAIGDGESRDYQLKSLNIDGSAITQFYLENCKQLTSMSFSGVKDTIYEIIFSNCSNLQTLDVTGCILLNTLDVSGCSSLSTITGLDDCTAITNLTLDGTAIETINFESLYPELMSLSVEGCESLTSIDLTRNAQQNTTNLKTLNVENCTSLTVLNLYNCNGITTLDTTTLTALKELNLTDSGVTTFNGSTTTMNFSTLTNLEKIYLNEITTFSEFDLSENTALQEFYLTGNVNVQSLDLTKNSSLKKLVLARTSALTTLNVTSWSTLETLSLDDVGLTALEISGATSLVSANILNNGYLANISISGASALESIRLSGEGDNYKLTSLSLKNCGLTSLDVTYLKALTSLDVSNCANLTTIEGLDSLTNLTTFKASGSGVEELDFSSNELLTTINLSDSAITNFTMNGDAKNLAVNSISVENCSELSEFTLINAPSVSSVNFATASNLTSVYIGNCSGFTGSYDMSNKTNLTNLNLLGCSNITSVNVTNCTSLASLIVSSTGITTLDVSGMTSISNLSVSSCTELTSVNISGCTSLTDLQTVLTCTKLEELNVSGSRLNTLAVETNTFATLNASNCESLTGLMINSSALINLNVSGSTNLIELIINNSNITDFTAVGLSELQKLEKFEASSANINDTDLSTILPLLSKGLITLNLSGNTSITTIDIGEFESLENLNVSGTSIQFLTIGGNQLLRSIDISNCTALQALQVNSGNEYTQLTSIITTGCIEMTGFQIEKCTALVTLDLSGLSKLNSVTLVDCTSLSALNVGNTALTSLDVSNCASISSIDVTNTGMTIANIRLPDGKDETNVTFTGLS